MKKNLEIPYGRQEITDKNIDEVVRVLKSDLITQGSELPAFEQAVCDKVGVNHAIAVSNGTAALHIACLALGLGPGDVVWTTPNTFVASANCALYCGASVDFVDIDPETFNLCPNKLEEKLSEAAKSRTLPKILIPVHHSGQPCDMEKIKSLADLYGIKIIEDASHAIGSTFAGSQTGSCKYSDIVVFSFHPVKIITTGEGGMALTNDPEIARSLRMLRSHGITKDQNDFIEIDAGPCHYEQQMLGYNYRMTDIQAALGRSQLLGIEKKIKKRQEIANKYRERLAGLPLKFQVGQQNATSANHLFVALVNEYKDIPRHKQIINLLRAKGVMVNLHYQAVHLQPYYQKLGFKRGQYPNAESYSARAISLPIYPTLTDQMQEHVIASAFEVLDI